MTRDGPQRDHDAPEHLSSDAADTPPSTIVLLTGAFRRLQATPRAVIALLLAGLVVTGVDRLRLHDPIPIVGYVGILDGRFSVLPSVPVLVFSRVNVVFSSFVGLKPQWLAWAIGLELLEFAVVVGVGAYVLACLLRRPLTTAAVIRYAGLVAVFQFGGTVNPTEWKLLVAIPVFVIWVFVLARLFVLPGLLIAGESVRTALSHSWRRTTGHGWSLFAVVILLGLLSHLGMSIPLVGPLGTALVANLHAGAIAVFLDRSGRES